MPNTIRPNDAYPPIHASNKLFERARDLIPGQTQLLAKGPTQWVFGVAPKYLERGHGARVIDVDGNEYLDLTMAQGPLSLGYGHPSVDAAIRAQLERGINFSLVHPLEVRVAELIRDVVPGVEMVRFSKTGADVTSAAVRVARAYTGRDQVLTLGYHGWHDWYIGTTTRSRGVPEAVRALTTALPYNDLDAVRRAIGPETACVILEPVIFHSPSPGYLAGLRRLCDERGALLIFDEMWTGFRLGLGGAQSYFDVSADLVTYSKAIANGMPLSVLAGKREFMRLLGEDLFFFTTFGGETLSLAAAEATIQVLRDRDVPTHLFRIGDRLREGYNAICQALGLTYTRCVGLGPRTLIEFDGPPAVAADPLEMKSLVQQEMLRRGVLWSGFHHVSFAHSESDVEYALKSYEDALDVLDRAVRAGEVRARLRGTPVQPVFRKVK
ncbi:MAG: aminotransferase class III-fold pyridoxal phosphate-dependent enzyme [Deltaproteobacteria bacterium]|nr:aminotransferase class III-fold pyridoxal phosphate-dependent enzyme [Deltaproteobacteria bacterium]